jgi:hypothetical protein
MKNKIYIGAGFVFLVFSGYYIWSSYKSKPYLIKSGSYPLTVQFISDTAGVVTLIDKNDTLFIEGFSQSLDSSGYINLSGHIENNVNDSFTFVGRINMFATQDCCGLIDKSGSWTFRRMEKRTFFRLKERDSLCSCDTCCIYLDIHLKDEIL